ncbi:MAG: SCO1664 family protein [Anaerolineales bacterium]|uniref:SCO1664 family protein n=1 Tax=Candidatus Villigracilis vicinus TaxID=3140679 RepID=UPI00313515E4|nr:SCO1664 family protein [Anaerolineales bacterium]
MTQIKTILTHGDYELRGQFMLGSNYTFLVDVHHEGETVKAVYKPSKGEQPLWDFPDNTLALRECAAYQLSEALGFHLVPVTIYRDDGPHGPGSLQQYIEYDVDYHYFNFSVEDKQKLRPVVLFDILANNADRKGSHVFFEDDTHRLFAIDHGICFHEEPKLRTVVWDFAGQAIPDELLAPLASAGSWSSLFEPYLNSREIEALFLRAEELYTAKVFPRPIQGRRAYPYPPI